MRHSLHTEIDIEAPPEVVWEILVDLQRYPEWNPFLVSARGTVAVGETLTNRLQPPNGKPRTFTPTVTIVDPPRTLEWLGHLGFRGIFDGRHRFELIATPSGTRLTHAEHFSGLLVRFLRRSLDDHTATGFMAMNNALKARAERLAAERISTNST
ncbi:MAG: SRPBCC family protein [Ilumatobacteraceae bacterium]